MEWVKEGVGVKKMKKASIENLLRPLGKRLLGGVRVEISDQRKVSLWEAALNVPAGDPDAENYKTTRSLAVITIDSWLGPFLLDSQVWP